MKIKTFRDLVAWQKAMELVKHVYRETRNTPDTERFGLTMQMRRAAVSVASNIAEENARQSTRDYVHFLSMARGSLAELETNVIIAQELKLIRETDSLMEMIQETRRILQALMGSLRKKQEEQTKHR